MIAHNDRPMVFFDSRQRRRAFFRAFSVFMVVVGIMALLSVVVAVARAVPAGEKATAEEIAYSNYYYQLPIHDKKLALTFDDGPDNLDTPVILDILRDHNVPAAFFLVGNHVTSYPDVARRIVAEGHSIGNHTFTHAHAVHDSPARLSLELRLTDIAIKNVTGQEPLFYRPPFLLAIGSDPTLNPDIPIDPVLSWVVDEGYVPVGADLDPKDWQGESVQQIIGAFNTELENGGKIILLHDHRAAGEKHTAAALPGIIAAVESAGYTFVPLEELLIPPSQVSLSRALLPGDTDATTGGEVSLLQWFLFTQGEMSQYDFTGVFDEATSDALRRWQTQHTTYGVIASGTTDIRTRLAMASIELPTVAPRAAASLSAEEQVTVGFLSVPSFITLLAQIAFLFVVFRIALFIWLFQKDKKVLRDDLPSWSEGVSVIIPAYNEGANIGATVSSVARTGYTGPFEIIVVDDGSTDTTAAVVRRIAAQNPTWPITLLQKQNGGKARALDYGMRESRYPIIVAIDGDAVLARGAIDRLALHFYEPSVAAVAGKIYTAGRGGLIDAMQTIEYMVGQNIEKEAFARVGAVGIVPGAVGAWRKSAILAAGGFSADTMVEDQDLTLAMLTLGGKVMYEPMAVAFTETPHTVRDFLKQRVRWVYGTAQCLWKYRGSLVRDVDRPVGNLVLPMSVGYNFILPMFYPIIDLVLIIMFFTTGLTSAALTVLLFTLTDIAYAYWGLRGERGMGKLLFLVPLQRFIYRPLLWYAVVVSLKRAIEGTTARMHISVWNPVARLGSAEALYNYYVPQTQPSEHVSAGERTSPR